MRHSTQTEFVLIALATFFMSMVPTVLARTCTTATAAGTWALTETGVLFLPSPSGSVPLVKLGILTFDESGNLVGTQTSNVGGAIGHDKVTGTLSLNPDCTGTVIARAFDPSSGALTGISITQIVLDDDAREMQAVITEELDGNGQSVPGVVTGRAKRLFAKGKGDESAGEAGCTLSTLNGSWGSAFNGTVVGVGPGAILGTTRFDGKGHVTEMGTAVVDGSVFSVQTTGMYTVNQNCTGTTGDNLGNSTAYAIVGDGKEIMAISTSTSTGNVVTVQLTKQD